ncbi:hypothetical protein FRC07_002843 [Ceratobasidium sp. 392]|nr:hypothetical protein FRC07_002843 [Ceratobasidium sp. 392]
MKSAASLLALAVAGLTFVTATPVEKRAQPKGIDVASYQGNVNWASQKSAGVSFAYVKATEGTDMSSGATQADYFVAHGGGWSADGKTLPGALDIEYNPYGATCYGLSAASMVSWVKSFSDRYHSKTGRYPTIYTTTDWWKTCTGNSGAFATTNALWIARYSSTVGTLPAGWGYHTFWQYSSTPLDQDYFNGDAAGLARYAKGS